MSEEILEQETSEVKDTRVEVKKENIDYQKIKSLMETQIKELADNMKESNYMQVLLEKAEKEKLTKQDSIKQEIEKIQEQLEESKLGTNEKIVQMQEEMQKTIQEEITKVDYAKQIQNMKEMMKKNNEDLLDTLQKEKDSEQAMQLLFNEKITQVQEEMQRTVQQEMTKIDYTEQILTINEMLNNLKDSYLEIVNEIKVGEAEKAIEIEQEPKEARKSKNIIDFKTLRKQKTKKMVYSIEEDIAYEDLAQTATYIIYYF